MALRTPGAGFDSPTVLQVWLYRSANRTTVFETVNLGLNPSGASKVYVVFWSNWYDRALLMPRVSVRIRGTQPILVVGAVSVGLLLCLKGTWVKSPHYPDAPVALRLTIFQCRSFEILLSPPRGDSQDGLGARVKSGAGFDSLFKRLSTRLLPGISFEHCSYSGLVYEACTFVTFVRIECGAPEFMPCSYSGNTVVS